MAHFVSSYSTKPAVFECHCKDNPDWTECRYQGRCRTPLAWALDEANIVPQNQCPFFTKLPFEIRNLIWEFTLTDSYSHPSDCDHAPKSASFLQSLYHPIPSLSRIGLNLLRTCRAVYLETYTLALSLNPFIILFQNIHTNPKKKILPWQLAHVQSLDVTLIQTELEEDGIESAVVRNEQIWDPKA